MREFEVTAPNGQVFVVTAQSEQEAIQMAQAQAAQAGSPAAETGAQPIGRLGRLGAGMMDPVVGAEQLLSRVLPEPVTGAINRADQFLHDRTGGRIGRDVGPDEFARQREQEIQARRAAAGQEGFDGMRMLGNVLSPANLPAFRAPLAATGAGRVAQGAGLGAAYGAVQPVTEGDPDDFARQIAGQATMGAAGGAVGAAVLNPLAAVGRGGQRPDVQTLMGEGVRPTAAQIAGGGARRTEETLRSVPVLGGSIHSAQRQGLEDFNRAAVNRAVAPIGGRAEGIGLEGATNAARQLDQAYDAARAMVREGVPLDQTFTNQMAAAREAGEALTDQMQTKLAGVLNRTLTRRVREGRISADNYKRIDSEIGREVARFRKSADPTHQEYAEVLMDVQGALRGQLARTNEQAAAAFRAADDGYRHLTILERATDRATANNGVFTPAQLLAAARQADTRVRNRGIIDGTATYADLAQAAQNVIGNRVPDSGTAGRSLLPLMLGAGGAGAVAAPGTTALTGMGLLGATGAYAGMNPLLRQAILSPGGGQILQTLPNAAAAVGGGQAGRIGRAPGLLDED